jgi:hypothetical protein
MSKIRGPLLVTAENTALNYSNEVLKKRTQLYPSPLWAKNYCARSCTVTALPPWIRELKKQTQTPKRPRPPADSPK